MPTINKPQTTATLKKFTYTIITLGISIPGLAVVSPLLLAIASITKFNAQLTFSKNEDQTDLMLKYYLARLIGQKTIDHYKQDLNLTKLLLGLGIFIENNAIRIGQTLIGSRIINAVLDELTVFEKCNQDRVNTAKKLNALFKSLLHISTLPLEFPRRIMGMALFNLIFPAQRRATYFDNYLVDVPGYKKIRYFIKSRDGVILEVIAHFPSVMRTTDIIANKNFIIRIGGNAELEEDFDPSNQYTFDESTYASTIIIAYNSRGSGLSTGTVASSSDLIHDAITVVKNLFDIGVKPERLVLDGFSLGGAIAALTLEHLFRLYGITSIGHINDRSFSKIGAFFFYPRPKDAANFEGDELKKLNVIQRNVEESFCGFTVAGVLRFLRLDLIVANIPQNLLQRKLIITARNDGVIAPSQATALHVKCQPDHDPLTTDVLILSSQHVDHCTMRRDSDYRGSAALSAGSYVKNHFSKPLMPTPSPTDVEASNRTRKNSSSILGYMFNIFRNTSSRLDINEGPSVPRILTPLQSCYKRK